MRNREIIKRTWKRKLVKVQEVCHVLLIVLLIAFLWQAVLLVAKSNYLGIPDTACKMTEDNQLVIDLEEKNYSYEYYLVKMQTSVMNNRIAISLKPTKKAISLCIIIISITVLSFMTSSILPNDCYYIISWHDKDDYFYVEYPNSNNKCRINRHFSLDLNIQKRMIIINDGCSHLELVFDKKAEKLLKDIRKQ